MEAVGYLICLGTDHAVSYMVDLVVKLIQCDLLKLWQKFAQLIIDWKPEVLIASQDIFIKSGLAFVDTHIAAASCYGIIICRIDILLKDGMTTLMDGRKHCKQWFFFVIVVADTHIF